MTNIPMWRFSPEQTLPTAAPVGAIFSAEIIQTKQFRVLGYTDVTDSKNKVLTFEMIEDVESK